MERVDVAEPNLHLYALVLLLLLWLEGQIELISLQTVQKCEWEGVD